MRKVATMAGRRCRIAQITDTTTPNPENGSQCIGANGKHRSLEYQVLRDGRGPMIGRHLAALRVLGAGLTILLVSALAAGCDGGGSSSALMLEHNALLADYAFDKPAPTSSLGPTFRLGGTATLSDASVRLGSHGLSIDVGPHRPGTWKGFFAATAATYPANSVIHVRMWRPSRSVPLASQSGIALLAVQTGASKLLDYVLVASVISGGQETWLVGHANGNTTYAMTKVLSYVPSTSTTEDVTLRTDGHSRYAVYFGDSLVYESKALKLGVEPPFRVYLEVEARGLPYQTRFQDLWIAAGNSVRVDGLDPGEHVTLTPDGDPPVDAVASATGQARLLLPLSEAVGKGTLTIEGSHTRRRFTGVAFAGGDVYRVRL